MSTWIKVALEAKRGGFPKCRIQFSRAPSKRITSAFCSASDLQELQTFLWHLLIKIDVLLTWLELLNEGQSQGHIPYPLVMAGMASWSWQ